MELVAKSDKPAGMAEMCGGVHLYFPWLPTVVEAVDLRRGAAAQPFAPRVLQQTRALQRSPKVPDYRGLETYVKLSQCAGWEIRAVKFEVHVVAEIQDTAQITKQNRL